MQRIVVPLDGSVHGERVLPYAVLLADDVAATIPVLLVRIQESVLTKEGIP